MTEYKSDHKVTAKPSEHSLMRHLSQAGECFRNLYTNDLLTDVNICIGDRTFSAHKTVLITHSEYLKRALIAIYREHGQNGHPEIQLVGLPAAAFQTILEFMYTAEIVLTTENIGDIHYTAQQLIVKDLVEKCENKLYELNAHDALMILGTSYCKKSDLCRRASSIVVKAFHEVMNAEVLMMQQFSIIKEFFTSDELVVDTEMDVFFAALAWIRYDFDNRFNNVKQILSMIRFGYIAPLELLICSEKIEGLEADFQQIMLHAMWDCIDRIFDNESDKPLMVLPAKRQYRNDTLMDDVQLPRAEGLDSLLEDDEDSVVNGKTLSEIDETLEDKAIIIVGGMHTSQEKSSLENTGKSIYAYTPDDQGWKSIGELPEPRHLHGVVVMMDYLYIVGGSIPYDTFELYPFPAATVNKWDIKTKLWSQCADMKDRRIHHSVTALNNRMYAVAGQTENGRLLTSVEVYTPALDHWEQVAPLIVGRIGAAVTTHNGKIILAGGYSDICTNLSGKPVMKTVEMYNPESDTWTSLADLTIPRCHSSLVEINGDLYVCGGATSVENDDKEKDPIVKSIANVDKYVFSTDRWQKFTSLKCSRHGARAVTIGSKVFIIGGVSTSGGVVNDIECLDMQTGLSRCSNLACLSQTGMGVAVCDAQLVDADDLVPERGRSTEF